MKDKTEVHCPACGAQAHYLPQMDRYYHDDGSDNRKCFVDLHRGKRLHEQERPLLARDIFSRRVDFFNVMVVPGLHGGRDIALRLDGSYFDDELDLSDLVKEWREDIAQVLRWEGVGTDTAYNLWKEEEK